ncbi:MAG: cytochrome b N-terminal domain-containing protein [Acidobacteria bacterium]|nr:cytochrome b N-terminal domain-containing protein [Acidobacteriota bacterium]
MSSSDNSYQPTRASRLAARTRLAEIADSITDKPSRGFSSWARTTAGVVALLLSLQLATGVLLAFVYVPSAESAHATVAYVEKSLAGGSWLRALHSACAQLLPLALVLHLLQFFLRGAHRRKPVGWLACLALLALSLAAGATGYSLPWDARAFASTRVAEGITRNLPLAGETLRLWLVGGSEVSTLTLSRFFALHALVIPFLILLAVAARLFVFREHAAAGSAVDFNEGDASAREHAARLTRDWRRAQLARNAAVAGVVFAALAVYASVAHAPLGPPAAAAPPGYLPRPGAQFLWLFQMLKYLPPAAASLAALVVPGLFLAALALLPFHDARDPPGARATTFKRLLASRGLGASVFALLFLVVAGLTAAARIGDARDPRVSEQLARQSRDEEAYLRAPFVPVAFGAGGGAAGRGDDTQPASTDAINPAPPAAYAQHCARCHGERGEGKTVNPHLVGISARPNRAAEDIVRILDDPAAYDLMDRMPSFKTKLTADEKRAIADWVVSLKAEPR